MWVGIIKGWWVDALTSIKPHQFPLQLAMHMKLSGSSSSPLSHPLPPQPTTMLPLHWSYREILEPPCMKPPWLTLHLLNNHLKNTKRPRSDGKDISWTFAHHFIMMNSKMMKETQVTDWLQVLVPTKRGAGGWELPPPHLQEGPHSHLLVQGEPCRQPHSPAICVTLASCFSVPQLLGPCTSLSSISLPIKKRNLSHGWCEN